MVIGVLALQGAFAEHIAVLKKLGMEAITVRTIDELKKCDGLIIPGGESTAMSIIQKDTGIFDGIKEWRKVGNKPVWGTCAGLILMSDHATGTKEGGQEFIGGLDVHIHRNYFGRQLKSFEYPLIVEELGSSIPYVAIFIRAPAITSWGDGVKILATVKASPGKEGRDVSAGLDSKEVKEVAVAVLQDNILGTSFHPELTSDDRWHKYFVKLVENNVDEKTSI